MKTIRVNGLPYRVEIESLGDEGYLAFIPTLGKHLFRGAGDTPVEAFELLEAMSVDVVAWLRETGQILAPPDRDEAKEMFVAKKPERSELGLRSITRYLVTA